MVQSCLQRNPIVPPSSSSEAALAISSKTRAISPSSPSSWKPTRSVPTITENGTRKPSISCPCWTICPISILFLSAARTATSATPSWHSPSTLLKFCCYASCCTQILRNRKHSAKRSRNSCGLISWSVISAIYFNIVTVPRTVRSCTILGIALFMVKIIELYFSRFSPYISCVQVCKPSLDK